MAADIDIETLLVILDRQALPGDLDGYLRRVVAVYSDVTGSRTLVHPRKKPLIKA